MAAFLEEFFANFFTLFPLLGPRDACWLIGHVDIHTVTGLLKSYLRELPESLFTNDMYQRYIEARGKIGLTFTFDSKCNEIFP